MSTVSISSYTATITSVYQILDGFKVSGNITIGAPLSGTCFQSNLSFIITSGYKTDVSIPSDCKVEQVTVEIQDHNSNITTCNFSSQTMHPPDSYQYFITYGYGVCYVDGPCSIACGKGTGGPICTGDCILGPSDTRGTPICEGKCVPVPTVQPPSAVTSTRITRRKLMN